MKQKVKIERRLLKRWLEELESGELKQGRGLLINKEGDDYFFCCLGVAQRIKWDIPDAEMFKCLEGEGIPEIDYGDGLTSELPEPLLDGSFFMDTLASLNDGNYVENQVQNMKDRWEGLEHWDGIPMDFKGIARFIRLNTEEIPDRMSEFRERARRKAESLMNAENKDHRLMLMAAEIKEAADMIPEDADTNDPLFRALKLVLTISEG